MDVTYKEIDVCRRGYRRRVFIHEKTYLINTREKRWWMKATLNLGMQCFSWYWSCLSRTIVRRRYLQHRVEGIDWERIVTWKRIVKIPFYDTFQQMTVVLWLIEVCNVKFIPHRIDIEKRSMDGYGLFYVCTIKNREDNSVRCEKNLKVIRHIFLNESFISKSSLSY